MKERWELRTVRIGGKGTEYDDDHIDKTYAHIDGGVSNPGYFTKKSAFTLGDVNGDGVIDQLDTAMLAEALADMRRLSPEQREAADVNGDGYLNVVDLLMLARYVDGLIDDFSESNEPTPDYDYLSWGVSATGLDEYAANLLERGKNDEVIVAVVDSGVDTDHPFLKDRLIPGYDFVDNDNDPQDEHGHGTYIAGTIVDSTPGMDNIKIMPVRVLGASGSGSYAGVAEGIRYAADNGANVINLGLGASHSDIIDSAVQYAINRKITIVTSSGNDSDDVANHCPAHIQDCITVAAADQNLSPYIASNYGYAVDIAAPGVDILGLALTGGYATKTGTSPATPFVSAAAALLICDYGMDELTPGMVSDLIEIAAEEWSDSNNDAYFGAGFLNMRFFIQ